jgi:hypothetical protein
MAATRLREIAALHGGRALLLAPYIRQTQARVLHDFGIDYVDLAGNVHLDAPGRFVHVEGKRPPQVPHPPMRLTKGWVKTVMALLVDRGLLHQPYRVVAARADVAVGTVTACLRHLGDQHYLARQGAERTLRDVPGLLAMWVDAYKDAVRPRLTQRRFQVAAADKREMWERLGKALGARKIDWALTGADAAERTVGHFHAENTEVYAPEAAFDDPALLLALPAQPAARGNLLVIDPPGPLALGQQEGGLPTAPLLLQYAELRYRGTEQAGEAADLLLPRLLEHEQR